MAAGCRDLCDERAADGRRRRIHNDKTSPAAVPVPLKRPLYQIIPRHTRRANWSRSHPVVQSSRRLFRDPSPPRAETTPRLPGSTRCPVRSSFLANRNPPPCQSPPIQRKRPPRRVGRCGCASSTIVPFDAWTKTSTETVWDGPIPCHSASEQATSQPKTHAPLSSRAPPATKRVTPAANDALVTLAPFAVISPTIPTLGAEQTTPVYVSALPHPPTTTTPAMDPPVDVSSRTRSRRADRWTNSGSQSSTPPSYGYHNTFHTHETPVLTSPPSYACANSRQTLTWLRAKAASESAAVRSAQLPPAYSCTVQLEGILGAKQELSSVFEVSRNRDWNDVYVVLCGTQLTLHRLKSPGILSKSRTPVAGKVIKRYSLQHAEVGVAADFKRSALTPKSPFAHLVPAAARAKLYETDPHLFEPVREHALRLRLETEQFLLCADSQEEMLTWVEQLCAAIDISPPLEDRSEPRYRSLPRRSRRQRVIDSARFGENLENLSSLDAGRRLIAEQEAIFRQLYPQLASSTSHDATANMHGTDPDREEFDPDDVRFPSRRPGSAGRMNSRDGEPGSEDQSTRFSDSNDPKNAPIPRPSQSQALRYRRRCAPALLACSPRVSDVVFSHDRRLRINANKRVLVEYTSHPPRYESHNFTKCRRPSSRPTAPSAPRTVPKSAPAPISIDRPASPLRGTSDDSMASFGYDLASTSSDPGSDDIRSAAPSEPPSPTALVHAKADGDAARQLALMGKRRNSEEPRENGLHTVALGVSLMI